MPQVINTQLAQGLADLSVPGPAARNTVGEGSAVSASVLQIPLSIQVIMGSTRLPLATISDLAAGSLITLDQHLGEPARILVNGREVAQGEVFVIESDANRLGIRITSISSAP